MAFFPIPPVLWQGRLDKVHAAFPREKGAGDVSMRRPLTTPGRVVGACNCVYCPEGSLSFEKWGKCCLNDCLAVFQWHNYYANLSSGYLPSELANHMLTSNMAASTSDPLYHLHTWEGYKSQRGFRLLSLTSSEALLETPPITSVLISSTLRYKNLQ